MRRNKRGKPRGPKRIPLIERTIPLGVNWPEVLGRPYLQDLQRERSMFAIGVLREQLKDRFAHMKEGDEFDVYAVRSACRAAWAVADIMIEEGVKP